MTNPERIEKNLSVILDELAVVVRHLDARAADALVSAILSAPTVFVVGAGRSGMVARGFAMRLMHAGRKVHVVGDTTTPAIRPGELLVMASGSGETTTLVAVARKAKGIGAKLALVTANPESTISALADVTVTLSAPIPKAETSADHTAFASIQPLGTLFEQCASLLFNAVIMELMARLGKTSADMLSLHANLE